MDTGGNGHTSTWFERLRELLTQTAYQAHVHMVSLRSRIGLIQSGRSVKHELSAMIAARRAFERMTTALLGSPSRFDVLRREN